MGSACDQDWRGISLVNLLSVPCKLMVLSMKGGEMKIQIWSNGMMLWERPLKDGMAHLINSDFGLLEFAQDMGTDLTFKLV